MIKYIHYFETNNDFDKEYNTSAYTEPWVSYTEENGEINYNKGVPSGETHEYVEIAGVKWATMNLGAENPWDYGKYYQWGDVEGYTVDQIGDTEGKKYFDWQSYKFAIGQSSLDNAFTKYNDSDDLKALELVDDAVNVEWGGNWRVATDEEWRALINSTTSAWTADYEGSGVAGFILTDNNDSSKKLFFPAAGYAQYTNVLYSNTECVFWSNHIDTGFGNSNSIIVAMGDIDINSFDIASSYRYYGYTLRGVLDE